MIVSLPTKQSDITLKQFQAWKTLEQRTDLDTFEYEKRKIKIFSGLAYQVIEKMSKTDYNDFLQTIDKALQEQSEFQQRFYIDDVEFGFINLSDLKAKEWFDLDTYNTNIESLHKLMAILFRPIVEDVSNNGYRVADYKGTKEYADVMKHTPLSVVGGALVFFWNLGNELSNHTLKFTAKELAKVQKQLDTLRSGDGMQHWMSWLKENRGDMGM